MLLGLAWTAATVGACAAFVAWRTASSDLGLCATVLLVAAPALASTADTFRPDTGDASLLPATADDLREIDRSLRYTRGSRAIALIGFSYALVLGFCQSSGVIEARRFVVGYSVASLAALFVYLPWMARREKSALERRATVLRSLHEFKASRHWDIA